ncbi:MAG: heavy metal translocating P-type ATPase [Hydrococcus sp. Prado102]|jgi:Cu2+-exporting ATPase|nr:heavy metal translocating P-type ATPase [Hydrococcus sp. Prado102]
MVQLVERSDSLVQRRYANRASIGKNNGHKPHKVQPVTYQIVHAVNSRIRFRIGQLHNNPAYGERLLTLIGSDRRFNRVRVNYASKTLTIWYVKGESQVQIQTDLIRLIQAANEPTLLVHPAVNQKQSQADVSFWSGLRLPTVATVLSVLGGWWGLPIAPILIRGTLAIAALPVLRRAFEGIRAESRLNVDFLDMSAIAITTLQGHFLTASSMVVLIQLGESIRNKTARSTQNSTQDLLGSFSQVVWVERDGQKQEIPLEEVEIGDIVVIYPGEQIPVDGRIISGRALIDEQKLTGESMPVVRSQGEAVYASTLVREGCIYLKTESKGGDTRAGRTVQLIQEAPIHDTRIENYASKIADRAVVPTILLGGLVYALTRNPARAASVLTLDFATGIRVSVPTTVLAALNHAARRGILIRSGRALEQLAAIDTIVFDKTGTLTQGEVTIVSIQSAGEKAPSDILRLAATAEQRITHPVAEAIARYAFAQGVKIGRRDEWHFHVGLGIEATIEGETVLVGSKRFLVHKGVSLENLPELEYKEAATIYIASDGQLQGVLQYLDPLRPESRQIVTDLANQGSEIHMLTGDQQQRAHLIATQLQIPATQVHAEAFPETKAQVVQQLQQQGKIVAFVGDGINDSAALAYADVSVSFRNGSDIARETADVVLMNDDLHGLIEAIAIARQAQQIIHQNTGIVAIPNLFGFVLAATVGLNPMVATTINNGSSVVAGANGLRPLLNGDRDR